MQKVYNIYDISGSDANYIKTVELEETAQTICRQQNKNGEKNYMYLESYE